jgi:hypothetical protein
MKRLNQTGSAILLLRGCLLWTSHNNGSHRLFMRDRKRQLHEFKHQKSMYLFAPAGEVVLTLGVAFNFVIPEVFPVRHHMTCIMLGCRKTKHMLSVNTIH